MADSPHLQKTPRSPRETMESALAGTIGKRHHDHLVLDRLPVVLARTGQSAATLWRGVKARTFPAPVRIGVNSVAWVRGEVDRWIEARIAERDQSAA